MDEAYVETTVLTDYLLKPQSSKQERAKAALARYKRTLLPVYSIKELKAGPMGHFAWLHDKLVLTGSVAHTLQAVASLPSIGYRKSTATEALAAAFQVVRRQPIVYQGIGTTDEEQADGLRIALASIILRGWKKRRKVTTRVVDELPCYMETAPYVGKDGLFEIKPVLCEDDPECCLADRLKARPDLLKALRDSISASSGRREDEKRREALKRLMKHSKEKLTRETCRDLGDAIFAFFCPESAAVLTTNMRDHEPLAKAVGKLAERP